MYYKDYNQAYINSLSIYVVKVCNACMMHHKNLSNYTMCALCLPNCKLENCASESVSE